MEPNETKLPFNSSREPRAEKPCWSRNRCELREWLRRNAPSLAELYEGAVSLLFDTPIPGYIRFVAHAVREIRNRLPDVISGATSSGRLNYKGRMDDLAATWKKSGFATDGIVPGSKLAASAIDSIPSECVLPRKIVAMMASFVADHEASREKPMDAAARLFEGVAPENQKFRNTIRPVVVQWHDITEWFMKRAHDSGAADNDLDIEELKRKFDVFELTLLGLIRGFSTFFATTDELDEILEDANS